MPQQDESAFSVVSRQLESDVSAGNKVFVLTPAFENTEDLSVFNVGDTVVFNKGDTRKEETAEIESIGPSSITLTEPLTKSHTAGDFVTISESNTGNLTVNETSVVTDSLIVGDPDQSEEENILEVEDGHIAADADITVQGDIFADDASFDNLDIQGDITVQGETVDLVNLANNNNNTAQDLSEVIDSINEGLSGVAEAINNKEHTHGDGSVIDHNHGVTQDLSEVIESLNEGLSGVASGIAEAITNKEHTHSHGVDAHHDHGTGNHGIRPTQPYVSPNYATDPTSPCPNTGYYMRIDECTNCYFEENLNQIGALAKQLVEFEFDYITGEAAVRSELYTISGSLSGRLGEMNVLLNQSFCFTGCDGNPFPRLGKEEGDILQQLYMRDYNTKQAQKIMRGLYDETSISSVVQNEAEWTELSEGDTTIRRSPGSSASSASNRIALSKDFKALSEDADRKIKQLVYNYNMYGAQPRQVAGEDGAYKMIVQSKKDY